MNKIFFRKNSGLGSLLQFKGEPRVVAKGFALGSFIGMLPFPGFQMLISAAIASILKYNKAAAIIGVFNTNLATGAFVFAFNFWLGKKVLGVETTFEMPEQINLSFAKIVMEAGADVFLSLLIGGMITGIIAMVLAYHISLLLLNRKLLKSENRD